MTNQSDIKKSEKYQLKMKLLRRIFIFCLMTLVLPLPLIPLIQEAEIAPETSSIFYFALIGSSVYGVILIAMAILGIGPVVIELLDIRKREKEERENLGMFP
ncbi:MAG: hypothetical protein PVF83_07320 [Anaerolineales bacterium]|jgi:hypothetical protein